MSVIEMESNDGHEWETFKIFGLVKKGSTEDPLKKLIFPSFTFAFPLSKNEKNLKMMMMLAS